MIDRFEFIPIRVAEMHASLGRRGMEYLVAVLVTTVAVFLRWLLDPWISDKIPFVTLFGAVSLAAWYGGYGPAFLASVLGYVSTNLFVIQPRGRIELSEPHQVVGLFLYLITCSIIIGVAEAMRTANVHRMQSEQEIERLNRELASRLEEWQTLVDLLPAGVGIAHDIECRKITHNPYISELLGVRPWENASLSAAPNEAKTPYTIYQNGEKLSAHQLPMQLACTGLDVHDFECEVVREGQPPVHLLCSARPLRDSRGHIRGSVGISLEITARKKMEAKLMESENRLAEELAAISRIHELSTRLLSANDLRLALEDVLANAIITSGADFGNIQLLNPQSGDLEIIAQQGFHAEFLEHFKLVRIDDGSACAQAMQTGERIVIEDVELDSRFEVLRNAAAAAGFRSVQSTPLKTRTGSILGMLSTHFRQPHKLSERNGRLLDLYSRHAADLIERVRIEQSLKDADRRKDEFLAVLAHELRNPLAPVVNSLELLRNPEQNDVSRNGRAIKIMERQIKQMVRLVDDLLDISRITHGRLQLRKETVLLADILEAAIETARPAIEESLHELTVSIPEGSIYVFADAIRLGQVFANLLHNAAKYSGNSGHIWLTAEQINNEAVVTVRDTGMGIATEHLETIFGIFSQVSSSLTRSQGGLGIGLSLVKGLTELHDGTVEVHSGGLGMGSEFVVRLPIVSGLADDPKLSEDVDKREPRNQRRRILVVDDLKDTAESMAMMLESMGHETRIAYDGVEAVQSAAVFHPHVVLLDIGLPKMNGHDAARHIRREPWGTNITLVALTGWGQEDDKKRAFEAGFDHHLTKPVQAAVLRNLLEFIDVS